MGTTPAIHAMLANYVRIPNLRHAQGKMRDEQGSRPPLSRLRLRAFRRTRLAFSSPARAEEANCETRPRGGASLIRLR
jgi:hypothetical protein